MSGYFQQIWKCRFFWMSLVRMDLRTRYRRSVFGLGWSLLNPIMMTVILCAVFCPMMGVAWTDYAPYVLAGMAFWQLFSTSCLQGCQSLFQNESYIRQQPMPLAIYPLRVACGAMIHFLIGLSVVLALVVTVPSHLPWPNPLVIAGNLLPALALFFAFAWSVAVIGAVVNVFFQDTQHLSEVFLQMLFYLTPIIWKMDMLKNKRELVAQLVTYNPLSNFLDLIRQPLLESRTPSWDTYAVVIACVVLTTAMASALMAKYQKRLIFHL